MGSVAITMVIQPSLLSCQENPDFVQVSGGDPLTSGYHSNVCDDQCGIGESAWESFL